MRITDQNIQLQAQHYLSEQRSVQRIHETYQNGMLANRNADTLSSNKESLEQFSTGKLSADMSFTRLPKLSELEGEARPQGSAWQPIPTQVAASDNDSQQNTLPARLQEMITAIESLMELLMGKEQKINVFGYGDSESTDSNQPKFSVFNPQNVEPAQPSSGERLVFRDFFQEIEQTQFQASGTVKTADGRAIDFNLNTVMARQFTRELSFERQAGVVMKDPLVINFNGEPASLTVDKFSFDLDADGEHENISFVNSNSGFLVLDKNQDGVINDGSELFGALTGDGFAELSQYDEDQNGWIDENDAIFSKLQIWQKDANGLDHLTGLMALNVGAIYLENISTEFALKDQNNNQHGQVRSSGVYLQETGAAGTIQQIDLVV